jgi:hypothetical protein
VSTKAKPHYPAENPKDLLQENRRGAIPSLPQYDFMAWCLVKPRDNFALLPLKYLRYVCDNKTMTSEISLVISLYDRMNWCAVYKG